MGYHVKSRQLYLSLLWGERYDIDSTHSSMAAISAPAGLSRCEIVLVVASPERHAQRHRSGWSGRNTVSSLRHQEDCS